MVGCLSPQTQTNRNPNHDQGLLKALSESGSWAFPVGTEMDMGEYLAQCFAWNDQTYVLSWSWVNTENIVLGNRQNIGHKQHPFFLCDTARLNGCCAMGSQVWSCLQTSLEKDQNNNTHSLQKRNQYSKLVYFWHFADFVPQAVFNYFQVHLFKM